MRIRKATTLAAIALGLAAAPAFAQHAPVTDADGRVFDDAAPVDTRPEWRGGMPSATPPAMPPMAHPPMAGAPHVAHAPHGMPGGPDHAGYERARQAWLSECRRNHRGRDRDGGLGGAAIGGVVGGVIGNRVAGDGDRLIGTVAGAAVGAAAGAAIDRADGAGRESVGDYCEQYLNYYSGGHQGGYGSYGYAQPVMMVPVMMVQQQAAARDCVETVVTEEWVEAAPRRRVAPRRVYRPAPDKRVRIAPAPSGKRVRM
jgi:hypothetical protein